MSRSSDDTAFDRSHKPRRRWLPFAIVIAAAVLVGVIAYWLAHSTTPTPMGRGRFRGAARGAGPGGGLTMPVGVATAQKGDIDIVLNALGTVTPLRVVTVSAQVAGRLQSVAFKEGQTVARGDLLAQIDPRTYQAALAQAQGALARDKALLANAKSDLARYQTLFKQDSIARMQLDSQASLVRQYEGTLKSDEGQIEAAQVNLDYTRILAPLDGRTGLRQVDPGNNVQSGTAIVVITQLVPIDVLFAIPEDSLPTVLAKRHAGTTLPVELYDRAGQTHLASGTLASIDNQIDTSTGTVKAKAEFANTDESLFPNQFVNVRLLVDTLHDALVIPTSALENGSQGVFVYVVQPDHTVKVQNVQTGPTQDERVAIDKGLKAGDVVVTSGADRLREGARVELPGEASPPARANAADGAQHTGDAQQKHWRRGGDQPGAAGGPRDGGASGNGAAPGGAAPDKPRSDGGGSGG